MIFIKIPRSALLKLQQNLYKPDVYTQFGEYVVWLSESDIKALLSKLDRVSNGEQSSCTLIKRETRHQFYPCTVETVITAVEDADYSEDMEDYSVIIYGIDDDNYNMGREPGQICPRDH